jgi:hypothetical protein
MLVIYLIRKELWKDGHIREREREIERDRERERVYK